MKSRTSQALAPWATSTLILAALATSCATEDGSPTESSSETQQRAGSIVAYGDKGPYTLYYEEIGGHAIFEGDIDLGPLDQISYTKKNVGLWQSSSLWPAKTIPYTIDSSLSATIQSAIATAISNWTTLAGFTFTPRTSETQYVSFDPGTDPGVCSSPLGRRSGATSIKLISGCGASQITHELGHAIGLDHTQNQCNRANFLIYHPENVTSGREHNFNVDCSASYRTFGWWETASIMHYSSFAFSSNGQPTLTLLDGSTFSAGSTLSSGDLQAVKEMYEYKIPAAWIPVDI
jgi:hypothetical protein